MPESKFSQMVTEKRSRTTDAPNNRAPAKAKKIITLVVALVMVLILGAGLTVYFGDRNPIGSYSFGFRGGPTIEPALFGTWDWEDFEPYYAFNTDGTGQRLAYDENMAVIAEDFA